MIESVIKAHRSTLRIGKLITLPKDTEGNKEGYKLAYRHRVIKKLINLRRETKSNKEAYKLRL